MADRISVQRRSENMSRIRATGTKPELLVRRYLTALGIHFRCNVAGLPGRPDIVVNRAKTVVFVHGCFWHRHAGCPLATTPSSNAEFWKEKFQQNVVRDHKASLQLRQTGWRVQTIWTCQLGKWGPLESTAFELLAELDR